MGITYAIIACYVDKGMKSKGSKSLMEFNKKKLLDYQIDQILTAHDSKIPYEIIIISNFDTQKIIKYFGQKIKVINLCEENTNPIAKTCEIAIYGNIFFIDYGCVYSANLIKNICTQNESLIISTKNNKISKLDIGITTDYSNTVQHLFFDLPNNIKFTNMFLLDTDSKNTIKSNKSLHRFNLMYFEILNSLISLDHKIHNSFIKDTSFIFFNNTRQKNAINKFIKQHQN